MESRQAKGCPSSTSRFSFDGGRGAPVKNWSFRAVDRQMWRAGNFCHHFLAGFEAPIDQTRRDQTLQGGVEILEMFALAPDGVLPFKAQPFKVVVNRGLVLPLASPGINILDPQKEASPRCLRGVERTQGRIGVAQMEPAGGRGRKAGDEVFHGQQASRMRARFARGLSARRA